MRSFLIAILALLWFILGWLYFQDYNKCCTGKKEVSLAPTELKKEVPILFNWGKGIPVLEKGWSDMKDSIALFATDTTSLEIVGYYCNDSSPEETESIGLERASETRKLFSEIPEEQIILLSKGINCDSSYHSNLFESVEFNVRKRTENIKEIDDRTLVYFMPNSTQKLNSAEVEAYLTDVAARVKKTGEKVQLTGYTDANGPSEENLRLGQNRADIIKNFLLTQGVPAENIESISKGEADPVAENNTPSGRSKNRRTELQIIK